MSKANVTEVVVYSITAESSFIPKIQEIVKNCLTSCPGYLGVHQMVGATDSKQLVDFVDWENHQLAEEAKAKFEAHPDFPELVKHLGEMKFSGHFVKFEEL